MKIKYFAMGDFMTGHRVELDIDYTISAEEKMTRDYPGCPAVCEFEIKSARVYYREGHIKKFRQMGDGFIGRIERDPDMMASIEDACWQDADDGEAAAESRWIDSYNDRNI